MIDSPKISDALTRILDAAESLVLDRGVSGLTIEATAQRAGISKGGLLYHFGTKEALLMAMLDRLAQLMALDVQNMIGTQRPGPGQVARALLEWAFGDPSDEINQRCDRISAVFLAAFHHDPLLLNPARAIIADLRAMIAKDGLPPGQGEAIMAAGDGLLMARIFNLYTLSDTERKAMRVALTPLTELGS